MKQYELIAPCHFGMEAVLKREIQNLGYEISQVDNGKVTFFGDAAAIARANIFLRTTERILLKIDSFRAGSGTILYFYDRKVVESLQKQYPLYADNFPVWASQSSAMLQLAVWSGLRELNIGASLQHYNPVIDNAVKELLHLSGDYVLVAEMPFGGIVEEPAPKDKEEIEKRVFSAC